LPQVRGRRRILRAMNLAWSVPFAGFGVKLKVHRWLLAEHRDLALIGGEVTTAMGGADNGENGDRFEGSARDEDALGIGALIGRDEQEALGDLLEEVVRKKAFDDFAVFEAQADPEAVGARAGGEGFADERFGVGEVADEVDAFDLAEIDADDGSGSIEELKSALMHKIRRSDVAGNCVAIHFAHDDFLMSRGHAIRHEECGGDPRRHWDFRIFCEKTAMMSDLQ